MAAPSIKPVFPDETVQLEMPRAQELERALWEMGLETAGAVAAAAKLPYAVRSIHVRRVAEFDERESSAVCSASQTLFVGSDCEHDLPPAGPRARYGLLIGRAGPRVRPISDQRRKPAVGGVAWRPLTPRTHDLLRELRRFRIHAPSSSIPSWTLGSGRWG